MHQYYVLSAIISAINMRKCHACGKTIFFGHKLCVDCRDKRIVERGKKKYEKIIKVCEICGLEFETSYKDKVRCYDCSEIMRKAHYERVETKEPRKLLSYEEYLSVDKSLNKTSLKQWIKNRTKKVLEY